MASKSFSRLEEDILVDADALVALAKIDDSNHRKALNISKKLQKTGVTWIVSPYTIAEAVTVLSYKVDQKEAKRFLAEVRNLDLGTLSLKEENLKLADDWFLKQDKKGTSYFDCYNMALLELHNKTLLGIFSFDRIYKSNGFKLAQDLI